jgi:hypothetical protein
MNNRSNSLLVCSKSGCSLVRGWQVLIGELSDLKMVARCNPSLILVEGPSGETLFPTHQ